MAAMELPFSKSEYDRRLALTRKGMEAYGLDALVVTSPAGMNWLTGYDGWSFYVDQAVIVTGDGMPYWWGRLMDANGARRTAFLDDDHILFYADRYIQADGIHPMDDLAEKLAGLALDKARIGVEMNAYYYSAAGHAALLKGLPSATIKDGSGLVDWQRVVKSDEEISFMRKAAQISNRVMTHAMEIAEPGMKKNRFVGELMKTAITGVDDIWGDYPAIMPLLPSGPDASAPHLTWSGDEFRTGEATFIEQAGCYRRYHAPLSRTVFFGKPPQYMTDAAEALVAGLNAGIEAARAGNRAGDIAAALEKELWKVGIERPNRCGYATGLAYPPDWGEHTVSIRTIDETVLKPGMTLHFMPGLWMDDWGLEITETILITENGPAEALCRVERKLFVKD
ncbi:M24 family metallopeptidase [Martelella mediterranea]|uniref:Putative peptidase n=1 Tax=Martelella mediterranea DSM 17316 TaxID=1122214 RepID=A0A1U9YVK1_9HYPH|nr:M24 family metallopeptidase [Martelella mediterranea]AQZ49461.1 putative peptidase [Martelella mediterranea DSM 17316]